MSETEIKTQGPTTTTTGTQRRGRSFDSGQRRGPRSNRPPREKSEFDSKVLDIARVTRVTRGGKRFSFRTTIVLGDTKGRVGLGTAQGVDVAQSMQKATNQAKKHMITIGLNDAKSIPHDVSSKYNSAIVLLKPASLGHGVKAGGPVRVIAKLAGIENITAKLIGRTTNKINIARATLVALAGFKK